MKKYLLGLIALVAAVTFSAFKSPFSAQVFKLTSDPVSANIVNSQPTWSTGGTTYTQCDIAPEDLACTIQLQSTTMSKFYHVDGSGNKILNDLTYAQANTATDARFLDITETFVNPRYKVSTIVAKKIVSGSVVTDATPVIAKSATLGSNDVVYFNARH